MLRKLRIGRVVLWVVLLAAAGGAVASFVMAYQHVHNPGKQLRLELEMMRKHHPRELELYCSRDTDEMLRLLLAAPEAADVEDLMLPLGVGGSDRGADT